MANVTWKSSGSGSWLTGSNWTTGKPPGAADTATIETSGSITVSIASGNNQVAGLYTYSNDALALNGGTLAIRAWGQLYGAVTESAKTSKLVIGGLGTTIHGTFKQSAGSVVVNSGTFDLAGGGSLAGTVAGAGWLEVGGGYASTTIEGSAVLSVAHLLLGSGGSLALGANLKYAGDVREASAGALLLSGKTATLTGVVRLEGAIDGGGALVLSGASATLDGATIQSGATVSVAGTTTVATTSTLGNSLSAATYMAVAKTGELVLAGGASLNGEGGQLALAASAQLVKTGTQTSTIEAAVSANASSSIAIAGGVLDLGGYGSGVSSLAGGIGGAGTLLIDSEGTADIGAHATLTMAALAVAGRLEFLGSQGYAGALTVAEYGSVTVDSGATLALSAPVELDGTLTGSGIALAGAALTVSPSFEAVIDGSATLEVATAATQLGELYVGYTTGSTAMLDVQSGATWTDLGSPIAGIGTVEIAGGASFAFAGDPGTTEIAAHLVNTGTVDILSGNLLLGGVGGNGSYEIAAGASLTVTGGAFPQAALVQFGGASGLLQVDGGGTFSLKTAGFGTGDAIDLANFESFGSQQPTVALSPTGVLKVTLGSDVANITLGAGVKLGSLLVTSDGNFGTAIVHV